jgi:NAD(P)-dependent dehydrogenase (short-subunit alcohol dehydrogenase family)
MPALDRQCVIVTGVSRGLGASLALALHEGGATVVGIGRRPAPALSGPRYTHLAAELADAATLDAALGAALATIARRGHAAACLVNNAATTEPAGLPATLASGDIERSLAINLAAPAALASIFLRAFPDPSIPRRVVNVSSGAAVSAIAGTGLYSVAKAGLEMLTRTLVADVVEPNFRAISLRPGIIDTDMQVQARSRDPVAVPSVAMFRDFHASGRLVPPDVVARGVVGKMIVGEVRNGATYRWPDLDRPLD